MKFCHRRQNSEKRRRVQRIAIDVVAQARMAAPGFRVGFPKRAGLVRVHEESPWEKLLKGRRGREGGELAGIRTQDPRLKRALLYQLSYELVQGR